MDPATAGSRRVTSGYPPIPTQPQPLAGRIGASRCQCNRTDKTESLPRPLVSPALAQDAGKQTIDRGVDLSINPLVLALVGAVRIQDLVRHDGIRQLS